MINLFVSTRGRLKSTDCLALLFVFVLLLQSCKVFEAQEEEETSSSSDGGLLTTLTDGVDDHTITDEAVTHVKEENDTTSSAVVVGDEEEKVEPETTEEALNEEEKGQGDNSLDETTTSQESLSSVQPEEEEQSSNGQQVDENSIRPEGGEDRLLPVVEDPAKDQNNDARYLLEQDDYESSCYDPKTGVARKCMPDFINAAFGLKITVSNTCGVRSITEFCVQTNAYGSKLAGGQSSPDSSALHSSNDFLSRVNSRCQKCDAADPRYAHPADYLNDYNNPENLTWWQSETMLEGVQSPNSVNLTLNLGKSFEINYIQLKFHSPRPESFAIYKRTVDNGPWTPYQFYSASCLETYGLEANEIVESDHEAVALCTDEFSDIAPLTGTSVVFGTLEDRPSAYDFENSDQLKEWVTATEIRISLDRLNTFGDEVFNDPQVLKSYYYAISDVAVGGWCKCNGHARRCVVEQQEDFEDRLTCKCEHFTDGVDCEKCLPFYNDRPWAPASDQDANECQRCSCNGLSSKCYFNQTLYDQTQHGGHCYDCDGNTEGPHCDLCKVGFYRRDMNDVRCVDCQCNPVGSESMQCDPFGRCKCKPGVVGDKCDRCAPYHYELSVAGCKSCSCNPTGSYDSPPVCDPRDGSCRCKLNVEGRDCDRPKPGHYHLSDEHVHGAMPCFCYAHSAVCNSSSDYFTSHITAQYDNYDSNNRWKSIDSRGRISDVTYVGNGEVVQSVDQQQDDVWLLLPKQFLGNQLHSYNQDLAFTIRLVPETGYNVSPMQARPSRKDIVIENSQYNLEIYMPIYGGASSTSNGGRSGGQLPSNEPQVFSFKLIQYGQNGGWMPTLSTIDFQRLLTNISAIKIRASYVPNTRAVVSKIKLGSAKLYSRKTELDEVELDAYGQMNRKQLQTALFVEQCKCPLGHVGQHCERCADGYRREPVEGGPFARCVPCNCNFHSVSCDSETGRCDCLHHTGGDNCEKCEEGYYGNPLVRPSSQLTPVSSSSSYSAIELAVNSNNGAAQQQVAPSEAELANMCKKCPCVNDGPCAEIYNYQLERTEVVCLACPPGTQGNLCELCDDGFYAVQLNSSSSRSSSSSLSSSTKTCEKCTCNGNIDENAIGNCDQSTGMCLKCVYNTTGSQCEKCLPNHWGNALTSVKCHACECDSYGTIRDSSSSSIDNTTRQCNLQDGQCDCLPNVRNRQCDQCKDGYWNIRSGAGCELCKCNPLGSYNLTCDIYSGQCHCRPGVSGLKCDVCKPLHYGFSDDGCQACECDPYGTESSSALQCDDFGKCKCKANFAGLKCNKCEENYYNFTSGCQKCDECYDLVQKKIGGVRARILTIQSSLNNLLSSSAGSLSVNEQTIQLQRKLDSLRGRVESYHQDLYQKQSLPGTYKDSLEHFRNEIKSQVDQLKALDQLFDQFNSAYRQAERLYTQVNGSVAQVHTQLNFIKHKNDDQRARLESVKQARQSHEQNVKLQGLAKQAREQAELQEDEAEKASEQLRTMISDAYSSIKELQDLVGKYDRMQADRFGQQLAENYETVKQSASSLITEAREQKVKLEESVKEVDQFIKRLDKFEVPDEKKIDGVTKDWTTSLDKFNNKIVSLRSEVDQVKSKFERFSDEELLRLIGTAQTQLNNAKLKQRDIDYLYGLAERVRNESEASIALANQVHQNATRILDTLKNFDELVAEGKERVKSAEELKTVIDQNVLETHGLVYKLRERVDSLKSKIDEMKRRAYESESTLREANNTFDQLQQKVSGLKQSATSLEDKSNEMVKNFTQQTTQSKVDQAVEVQKSLNERSDSVLKQADEVANRTQRLLDNANNGLEGLNRINKSLSDFSVSNIKKEDIARLQAKFNELSSQLDSDKQVDDNISNLEKSGKYLLNTAKQYRYQVELLRKEIENLEQINNSLERKCFANTFAKPEL